jgi:hypothetical protein
MAGLSLDVGEARRVVRHIGENESLFMVVFAQHLVLAQVRAVAHTEPATKHVHCHYRYELPPNVPCKQAATSQEVSYDVLTHVGGPPSPPQITCDTKEHRLQVITGSNITRKNTVKTATGRKFLFPRSADIISAGHIQPVGRGLISLD